MEPAKPHRNEPATACGISEALALHREAFAIAAEVGARDQQARAQAGLGRALLALGEPDRAERHFREALAVYTDLESPDADEVRTLLAAIEPARLTPAPTDRR